MRPSTILQLAILLVFGACGSDPGNPLDGAPIAGISLDVVAGDSQVGTVGEQLAVPLTVRVMDDAADGPAPMAGVLVNFVVVQGGGSVFAGAALTDSLGQAADRWTLGTVAGEHRLEVRAVRSDGTPVVFATARATANPGPLAYSGFTADTIHVLGAQPVAVGAIGHDEYGNPVDPPTPTLSNGAFGTIDRLNWTPTSAGRVVLRLPADSLVAFVFPPTGAVTITRVVADTTYVETGTLVLDQVAPNHTHSYELENARSVRTTPAGSDTVFVARGGVLVASSDQPTLTIDLASIRSNGLTSAWTAVVQAAPVATWQWTLNPTTQGTLVIQP